MKKVLLLGSLFFSLFAQAQFGMSMHHPGKDSAGNFQLYKNLGVSFQSFDNLNSRLSGFNQYKSLPEAIATIGIGSKLQMEHFVAVNGLTAGWAMNGNRKNVNSTLGFLGINGDLGYDFLGANSRGHIYPTVGLGLEGFRARLNKNLSQTSFNDVLGSNTQQNNTRSLSFYNLFFNYRFGLNFAMQSKDKTSGIGLQLGYTGSFNKSSWKINYNQDLLNAPQDRLSRLFANIYLTKTFDGRKHGMM